MEHLLTVRCLLAPAYTRDAVAAAAEKVTCLFDAHPLLEATPEVFADYDWKVHQQLAILSGNPVFTMILNGFSDMYQELARLYFRLPEAKKHSLKFYQDLRNAAAAGDSKMAEQICNRVMQESIVFWKKV